jgi:choline-sulfatase
VRRTFNLYDYTEEQIRVARAAYYGLVTYMDDKIGRLVGALRETGQLEDTLVVYTSDHGELAGDHGLWWKNSFYEQASRVPLILSWPGALERVPAGARFEGAVSLLDLTRTLIDVAGVPDPGDLDLDGDSLLPPLEALAAGDAPGAAALWKDEAIVEYYGHATNRPQRMLRAGRWKYNYYHGEPAELYDLAADPQEFHNLAGEPRVAAIESAMRRRLLADWDPDAVAAAVRRSQRARQVIGHATGARRREGEPEPQGIPGA